MMRLRAVLCTLSSLIMVTLSLPHHHDYHDDYDDEDYVDYPDKHHHSKHVIIIKTNDLLKGAAAAASTMKPKTTTRTTTKKVTTTTTTRPTTTTTTPKPTTTTSVVRNLTIAAEYIVVDHVHDHGHEHDFDHDLDHGHDLSHDYELHRGEDRYFDQYRDLASPPDRGYYDHERDHDVGQDTDHDNDHFRRRVEESVVDSPEHHRHRHHGYRHYHHPHHHVGVIEVEVPEETTMTTTTTTTTTPKTTTPPNEECSFQVDLKSGQVKSLPRNTTTVKWLRMPRRNRRACSMRGVLMLRPPKKAKAVKFVMTFEKPFRYSFHIADTPENKGWGSNEGEDRFDAEIFSWDNDLLIYKSSYGRHRIVNNHRDWINDTISVQVARNVVDIKGSDSNQTAKYTDTLFHFKPTKSQKLMFLGLNRVVHSASGKPYRGRHGSGLCSACIIFK